MEYRNDPDFLRFFELRRYEKSLKKNSHYEKEVISIYKIIEWNVVLRCDDAHEEKSSKYTGIRLFVDERDEFLNISVHIYLL
jgi:hypothetical protein